MVILNWNHTADTVECAKSFRTWAAPPTLFLVDNASDDAAEDVFRAQIPAARVLMNPANLGFGGGNNAALQMCVREWQNKQTPAYVLLLNNDAVLTEATANTMLEHLQHNPNIGMLGTAIQDTVALGRDGAVVSYGGRDVLRWFDTRERTRPHGDALRDVFYVPATAAMLRTQALADVGLFDTDYFFGMEAVDWCVRACDRGWRTVIAPDLTVVHRVERSGSARNTLHAYYSVRNRFLFIHKRLKKQGLRRLMWLLRWTWRALLAAADAIVHGQTRRAQALMAALVDGLGNRGGRAPETITR